jgi:hypothetical protein
VGSAGKQSEKPCYMHRNPVTHGLVCAPELWARSRFRWYACAEAGVVKMNEWPTKGEACGRKQHCCPPFEKREGVGHTHFRDDREHKGWANGQLDPNARFTVGRSSPQSR